MSLIPKNDHHSASLSLGNCESYRNPMVARCTTCSAILQRSSKRSRRHNSTTRHQSTCPNSFHHITGVAHVRSVGCNWNFFSPGMAPFCTSPNKRMFPQIPRRLYKGATLNDLKPPVIRIQPYVLRFSLAGMHRQ